MWNSRSPIGQTPLSLAASYGQVEWVIALLEKGAKVNERNLDGDTALLLASKNEQVECANVLIKAGANVNMRNYFGDSPFKAAFATPNIQYDIVQSDVNIKFSNDMTPLLYAALDGNVQCISTLLEAGADVNISNENGVTPLINANYKESDKPEVVEALLKAGADVNSTTKTGINGTYECCL